MKFIACLDLQVSFVTAEAMEDRMIAAEYAYATEQLKPMMTVIYLNKVCTLNQVKRIFTTNLPI